MNPLKQTCSEGYIFLLLYAKVVFLCILGSINKTRLDSRTSLTGLSVLLRYVLVIFTLMNPVGPSLGRRYRFRVRPRSPPRPILCYGTPSLEVDRWPFARPNQHATAAARVTGIRAM
jgi:hypothetical protein